ncbi:gem-associated protein 7 [Loa loa]|uniref:Gem-associated protein 7 n=2 Tax=Loa loa TaxID=7209 RepID=A0A1S0U695_LOALO|nr:gem-associated protein 7 [Loa loa]EFO25647.2 gem-associated protein 7 [Loa loa]
MMKETKDSAYGESVEQVETLEQEQRTELRERFLRMMSFLGGKQVELDMHERTQVVGKFGAVKADLTHYIVDALITPIGVINHAILRMNDTIIISTSDLNELSNFKIPIQ